jgi:hypothetical protein
MDGNELVAKLSRASGASDVLGRLYRPLLSLLQGEPVPVGALAATTGKPIEEVRGALASLPDTEFDDQGPIVGYGLTLRTTEHPLEVELDLGAAGRPAPSARPAPNGAPARSRAERHRRANPAPIRGGLSAATARPAKAWGRVARSAHPGGRAPLLAARNREGGSPPNQGRLVLRFEAPGRQQRWLRQRRRCRISHRRRRTCSIPA